MIILASIFRELILVPEKNTVKKKIEKLYNNFIYVDSIFSINKL